MGHDTAFLLSLWPLQYWILNDGRLRISQCPSVSISLCPSDFCVNPHIYNPMKSSVHLWPPTYMYTLCDLSLLWYTERVTTPWCMWESTWSDLSSSVYHGDLYNVWPCVYASNMTFICVVCITQEVMYQPMYKTEESIGPSKKKGLIGGSEGWYNRRL